MRQAHPEDVETLLAIQREAALDAYAHIYPPERYPFPNDDIRAAWAAALADPEVEVYLGESDGVAAGSVSVAGDFLRTLYVRPADQGRGVGSALHDFALERLRERGIRRAKLWTLEENASGRRFYERRGWRLTDETRIVPFPPHPLDVQYALPLEQS